MGTSKNVYLFFFFFLEAIISYLICYSCGWPNDYYYWKQWTITSKQTTHIIILNSHHWPFVQIKNLAIPLGLHHWNIYYIKFTLTIRSNQEPHIWPFPWVSTHMNHIAKELTKRIGDNLQRINDTEMTQTKGRPKAKLSWEQRGESEKKWVREMEIKRKNLARVCESVLEGQCRCGGEWWAQ